MVKTETLCWYVQHVENHSQVPSALKHPEAHVYALRHPNRPLCPLVHTDSTIKHSFRKQWAMYRLAGKPQSEFSVTGQGEMGSSPSLDHRKKCFQPQSWLKKYSFCRKQNVSSLGIFFFFFVLSLLFSRKGKCLSKRPSKHLRKPKTRFLHWRERQAVSECFTGQGPVLGQLWANTNSGSSSPVYGLALIRFHCGSSY